MAPDDQSFDFQVSALPAATIPLLATSDRQDRFSMGIVAAIISTAGYNTAKWDLDRGKTDIEIRLPDVIDDPTTPVSEPKYNVLQIQVKCTYAHNVAADGYIHFPVDVKTHHFLVHRRGEPRILVLVHVPRPQSDTYHPWCELNSDHIVVRNSVYWLSLMGQLPTTNPSEVVVKVPIANKFTVSAVHTLVQRIAVQGDKLYAG